MGNDAKILAEDAGSLTRAGFDQQAKSPHASDHAPEPPPNRALESMDHRSVFVTTHPPNAARHQQLRNALPRESQLVAEIPKEDPLPEGRLAVRRMDDQATALSEGPMDRL